MPMLRTSHTVLELMPDAPPSDPEQQPAAPTEEEPDTPTP
jgi:hypothetical protein